jgi:hypothetical protein
MHCISIISIGVTLCNMFIVTSERRNIPSSFKQESAYRSQNLLNHHSCFVFRWSWVQVLTTRRLPEFLFTLFLSFSRKVLDGTSDEVLTPSVQISSRSLFTYHPTVDDP